MGLAPIFCRSELVRETLHLDTQVNRLANKLAPTEKADPTGKNGHRSARFLVFAGYQNSLVNNQYKLPDSRMAAGKVRTQASARLRRVRSCRPEPLAVMLPATPDDST